MYHPGIQKQINRYALQGAGIYLILGFVWILTLNLLLPIRFPAINSREWLRFGERWLFVIVSSGGVVILLHYSINRFFKAGEATIVSTSEKLSRLANHLDDVIFRYQLKPALKIEYINPAVQKLTGYNPDLFIRHPVFAYRLIHPEDRERFLRFVENPGQLQRSQTFRILTDTGDLRWIKHQHIPILNENGDIIALEGIAQDVSHEKELAEIRARLAAIFDSSHDAIIGKDLDGNITDWNKGATQLYGYSAEEVLGRSISLIIPDNSTEELDQIMEKIRDGKQVKPYETTRITKAGKRVRVLLTVSPIKSSENWIIGASAIAKDLSSYYASGERHVKKERTRLLRQVSGNFGIYLDKFCDQVNLGLDNLYRDTLTERQTKYAEQLRQRTVERKTSAKWLVNYSNAPELHKQDGVLQDFIMHLTDVSTSMLSSNVTLNGQLIEDKIFLSTDFNYLQSISLSLFALYNNISAGGGEITVGTYYPTQSEIANHIEPDDQNYICITFTSPAISDAARYLTKIITPALDGRRLGDLSEHQFRIARALHGIAQLDGWINLNSTQDDRIVCTIGLPQVKDHTEFSDGTNKFQIGAGCKILLIDSDIKLRSQLSRGLESQGYSVLNAGDTAEAMTLFEQQSDEIAAVYCDLAVQTIGGLQLVQRMRTINPIVRFVGASEYETATETDKLYLQDFDVVLNKPFEVKSFLQEVFTVIWAQSAV